MNEVKKVLDGGVIEKRIYDEDGKLVDIRKEYPPRHIGRSRAPYVRTPGTLGGHERET